MRIWVRRACVAHCNQCLATSGNGLRVKRKELKLPKTSEKKTTNHEYFNDVQKKQDESYLSRIIRNIFLEHFQRRVFQKFYLLTLWLFLSGMPALL